jgi:hypothetical protein
VRVLRLQDWSRERGGAVLGMGSWGGLSFASATLKLAGLSLWFPEGFPWDPRSLALLQAWAQEVPGRWLMFTPEGAVVTAGIPTCQGQALLVVAAGMRTEDETLEKAWQDAYTVEVSPRGMASLVPGVRGLALGGRGDTNRQTSAPVGLPAGLGTRGQANRAPTVDSLEVVPQPDLGPITVPKGGTLSLVVRATDPDSDRLYCTWGSEAAPTPPGGATPPAPTSTPTAMSAVQGTYSVGGRLNAMSRMGTGNTCRAAAEWTPPATAKPGDWFHLGVLVEDLRGGRDARWVSVRIADDVGDMVVNVQDTSGAIQVYAVRSTGDWRPLTRGPASFVAGQLSSYSRQIVYAYEADKGASITEKMGLRIGVMNQDGSDPRTLLSGWEKRFLGIGGLAPDGLRVLFSAQSQDSSFSPNPELGGNGLPWHIFLFSLDGAGEPVEISRGPYKDVDPSWHPGGRWVVYVGLPHPPEDESAGPRNLYLTRVPAPGQPPLPPVALTRNEATGWSDENPQFSPDGRYLAFTRGRDDQGYFHQLYVAEIDLDRIERLLKADGEVSEDDFVPYDGSNAEKADFRPLCLTSSNFSIWHPRWNPSPAQRQLVCQRDPPTQMTWEPDNLYLFTLKSDQDGRITGVQTEEQLSSKTRKEYCAGWRR